MSPSAEVGIRRTSREVAAVKVSLRRQEHITARGAVSRHQPSTQWPLHAEAECMLKTVEDDNVRVADERTGQQKYVGAKQPAWRR